MKNIHQRLNAVRIALGDGYLQKDARVTGFGGGYSALTYDKLIRHVRPHLLAEGVMPYPSLVESSRVEGVTKSGGFILRYSATYDVTFVNADDPADRHTVRVEADANDSGDKAPSKALTVALRLALRSALSIETGEDEEADTGADESQDHAYSAVIAEHLASIEAIKTGIATGDLESAAEAWFELTPDTMRALWVAPSKGGVFTTAERGVMKSDEFAALNPKRRNND